MTVRLLLVMLVLTACEHRSPLLIPKATPTTRGDGPPSGIEGTAIAVGDPAPATSLRSDAGETWTLAAAITHGPVVIVFYRGDWCPFCRKQLLELQDHFGEFAAKHASVVAVSVDAPDRSRTLAGKLGLAFPILSDPDRNLIRAWGVEDADNGLAWPSVFVVGGDGTVVARWVSTSFKVRPSTEEVLAGVP